MPKSNHTLSPPRQLNHKQSLNATREHEDSSPKMSETAMRKKKNADAQAAFRARRANYIATLEETVTSLESVVLQLQDSCREARSEAGELRQENARLVQALDSVKHESREREKLLRAFWQSKKSSSHDPTIDDLPPPPPFASVPTNSGSLGSAHMTSPGAYAGPSGLHDPMRYTTHDDSSAAMSAAGQYHPGPPGSYGDRSPSLPYINHDGEAVNAHGRPLDHRLPKLGHFAVYNIPNASRDSGWHSGVPHSTPTGQESGHPESSSSSHSPGFIESPNITAAEMPSYVSRFPTLEDQKTTLPSIDAAPYMFGHNRSISPANSNHTGSSTSVSSTNFQFVFPPEGHDRADQEYRRHTTHGAEVTLHGGTADVSSYGMGPRRTNAMLGAMPPFNPSDDRSRDERAPSETATSQRRLRRHVPQASASRPSSRSPSPTGQPPISSTLAVIKAQAFGALRRTRTRPKKATDGAAKAAMEVLEARGIGLGIGIGSGSGQKRQRIHTDDEAMQS